MTVNGLTDEEIRDVRESPAVWMEAFGFLEDTDKNLRRCDPPGEVQQQIFAAYEWCQANRIPCRLVVLKSRKEGASTAATALAYHHLVNFTSEGVIIGTDNSTSDNLVLMLRRFADNDIFPWGSRFNWKPSVNSGTWTHGSVVKRDTAMDPKSGRAATIQVAICTECAHWPNDGVRSADEVMLSLLNSMPSIDNIVCIMDSTANGANGFFYETYSDGVTLEERKSGKSGNGWIKIFVPWFKSPHRSLPVSDKERAEINATLTEEEQAGIARFGWSEGQLKWRRETIAAKCGGEVSRYHQEYPSDDNEAFLTSGSPRFNVAMVGRMLARAEKAQAEMVRGSLTGPRLGHLVESGAGIVFMPTSENAWLWISEAPKRGCDYLEFCDPMTGAQSAGAKVRDRHATGILRGPYADERGIVHQAAVIACLYHEDGCRWEMDVLADRMRLLQRWFGECIIVPEVNKAMDLIPLLRERGATFIYHRPIKPDAASPSTRQKAVGFLTTSTTRNLWVNALGEAIREQSFECLFLPAIKDFASMIVNEDGRAEAAPKKHDDWCAGIGIGLLTLNAATRFPLLSNTGAAHSPVFAATPYGACG